MYIMNKETYTYTQQIWSIFFKILSYTCTHFRFEIILNVLSKLQIDNSCKCCFWHGEKKTSFSLSLLCLHLFVILQLSQCRVCRLWKNFKVFFYSLPRFNASRWRVFLIAHTSYSSPSKIGGEILANAMQHPLWFFLTQIPRDEMSWYQFVGYFFRL